MDEPFESLSRGLNKDLGALLGPKGKSPSLTRGLIQLAPLYGMPNFPMGLARGREESVNQKPFESLSDHFVQEIAVFPVTNRVVINKFGAFVPQSIFGSETELAYRKNRNPNGTVNITVHSINQSELPTKAPVARERRFQRDDPIFEIGKNPVACSTPDASEDLDKYLYGVE